MKNFFIFYWGYNCKKNKKKFKNLKINNKFIRNNSKNKKFLRNL